MLSQKVFEEISGKIGQVLAESPAKDLKKNLRAMLQSAFAKLDLVTREEFEVQQAVLLRTREELTALETRIAALEQRASAGQGGPATPESPAAG